MADDASFPEFPRGFILSKTEVTPPAEYVAGPILDNFFVHQLVEVDAAQSGTTYVVVLGLMVDSQQKYTGSFATRLLSTLAHGNDALFRELHWLVGRYSVIFGDETTMNIVTDATGMRSVFYAEDASVVGSHAFMVERYAAGKVKRSRLPSKFGHPGNRTPYPHTKVLTPNTFLDITHGVVHRFWPSQSPTPISVEEAATTVLAAAAQALKNLADGRLLRLALTAGLDSRVMMAVVQRAGVDVETYTYGTRYNTSVDRNMARDLAAKYSLKHHVVPQADTPPALSDQLNRASYSPHHAGVVASLRSWFGDPRTVAISGNLLEIGRVRASNHFVPNATLGIVSPDTPGQLVKLHHHRMNRKAQLLAESYGREKWLAFSEAAFTEFMNDTDFGEATTLIDAFDLYYWEHRMGTWHGPAMNERDFYADAFIPFNARGIFETMLGVDLEKRTAREIFYAMIRQVDEHLLDLPVNPTRWPPN